MEPSPWSASRSGRPARRPRTSGTWGWPSAGWPAGRPRPTRRARWALAAAAGERLSAALARWPDDVQGWMALGKACEARAAWEGAHRAGEAAVARAPGLVEGWALTAAAAAAAGRYEAALAAATEWVRLSPSGVDPRLLRADIRLRAGDAAGAEADCRAALALHPLHPGPTCCWPSAGCGLAM